MKMRYILIIVSIIVVVALGAWLSTQTQRVSQEPKPAPAQTTYVEPPPRSINFPAIPRGVVFTYGGPVFQPPTTIPLYSTSIDSSTTTLYALATTLSDHLGFVSSPSAIINRGDFSYVRNENEKTFVLTKTKNIVGTSYQLYRAPADAAPAAPEQAATSFVRTVFSPPPQLSLSLLDTVTTGFDGLVVLDRPIPNMTGYIWGFSIEGHPILTEEYSEEWSQVVADEHGVIRSASYTLPPVNFSPSGTTPVISVNDAVANLNAGRGAILNATTGETPGYGETPDFTEARITSAFVSYLLSGGLLRPVYVFDGVGVSRAGKNQQFRAVVMASH